MYSTPTPQGFINFQPWKKEITSIFQKLSSYEGKLATLNKIEENMYKTQ